MALGKEEIQKAVLGLILFVFLIYAYFTFLLGPLSKSSDAATSALEVMNQEMTDAKKTIARSRALEASAPEHALTLKRIEAQIPDGSPIAWFPPRINALFRSAGIDRVPVRSNGDSELKELPGFRITTWGVDVENIELEQIGRVLSQFENEEILGEIRTLQIDNNGKQPGAQHMQLTLTTIVKK